MNQLRLRAGDVIRFGGKACAVVRVNDCAAVVAVTKKPREFTTLFGVRVTPSRRAVDHAARQRAESGQER